MSRDKDLVVEAQKILDEYIERTYNKVTYKKKKKFNWRHSWLMVAYMVAIWAMATTIITIIK